MNLQNQMYQLKIGESPSMGTAMPKSINEKNQSSPQDIEK
jgi:hypothetical protein